MAAPVVGRGANAVINRLRTIVDNPLKSLGTAGVLLTAPPAYDFLDRALGGKLLSPGIPGTNIRLGVTPEQLKVETAQKADETNNLPKTSTNTNQKMPDTNVEKSPTTGNQDDNPNTNRGFEDTYQTGEGLVVAYLNRLAGIDERKAQILEAQLNPARRREFLEAEADAQIRVDNVKGQLALEKMREKSDREQSIARINAWKEVERAAIQSNALIAANLANTAYIAGTPNANVLSALSGPLQAATNAFRTANSVISSESQLT